MRVTDQVQHCVLRQPGRVRGLTPLDPTPHHFPRGQIEPALTTVPARTDRQETIGQQQLGVRGQPTPNCKFATVESRPQNGGRADEGGKNFV
jgi:hypothetical protein